MRQLRYLGAGFGALSFVTAAHAQADATLTRAAELEKAGRPGEAYELLQPRMQELMADPEYNYIVGLAALDTGRIAEAILAFQRVLAIEPDHAQARAEIARAYALAGDIDTARAQFDTVLQDPSLPDPVRQRFVKLSEGYTRQIEGGGTDVTGFADLSAGYDSNVNNATDLTSVTIPLFSVFGPGTLSGAARAQDDGFVAGQAGVSVVHGFGRADRIFGSVLGSYRGNTQRNTFNQGLAAVTAGFAHSFANRDTVSLSGQFQQFWYGDRSYRQAAGAIVQYTHMLKGGQALSVSAQYFRLNFDHQPLLDTNRFAGSVSYAGRQFVITATGGHEETARQAGDAQSFTFGTLGGSAELPLDEKLSVVGGATFDLRRYDAADPLFLKKRKDERVDAELGLKYRITPAISLRPQVSYTRNFSNIPIDDFERWTASFGVRYEF